jgi:ribosomal protein S4
MKRFFLKKANFFKYSYFISNKIIKLTKKKWNIYKRLNFRYYLNTKRFYRYDFIKVNKRVIFFLKRIFKEKIINKQWIKHTYGGFTNKLFKLLFLKNKPVFFFLESRLDTLIFRSNLITNILTARYLINHNKIKVNGKFVNKSNLKLKQGDIVDITTLKDIKIIRFIPMYLEVNHKVNSFILLNNLERNLKDFLIFLFNGLHFHKIYNFFVSNKKS